MSLRGRNMAGLPGFVSVSALIAGFAGIVVALYVPNAYDKTIPPFIILGALGGLYVSDVKVIESNVISLNWEWTLITYFTLAGATVLAYITTFQRSPLVNALLVGLYLISAVSVLVFTSPWGKLALPLVTAFLHRGFIYYASAVQLGLDSLFHNRAAGLISSTGTLEALSTSKYWYTSGYHLLTAASTSVFDIPVRDAAFIAITLVMVFVAPIAIFAILRRDWGANVGAVGAFLFLAAGKSVSNAVHTSPTTLGAVFFILLLLFIGPYLSGGQRGHLGAIGVVIAGLAFTHQLSLFVAVVGLGLYTLAFAIWSNQTGRTWYRVLVFNAVLLGAFLVQTFVTKYDGPRGERSTSFFMEVAPEVVYGLLSPLREGGGRTASFPPGYAVSGADALTVLQVLGKAILFGFALVGTIYWLKTRRKRDNVVMGLGVMVASMSLIVFGGALIGTNVFIPGRWFGFLITPLALLAAPGVLAVVTKLSIPRDQAIAVAMVLLLVTTPYVVFMFGSAVGSPDGPIFDDAPGANRITTTTAEAQLYQFVDDHAGESTVAADHLAWQVIERHYGQPSRVYRAEYGQQGTTFAGEQLIVHREYASTKHASYEIVYQDRPVRVYAPLPDPQESDSIVYTSGDDRLVYRPEPIQGSSE